MDIRFKFIQASDKSSSVLLLMSPKGFTKLTQAQRLPKSIDKLFEKGELKKLFQQYGFKGKDKQSLKHQVVKGKAVYSVVFYGIDSASEKEANFYRNHGSTLSGLIKSLKAKSVELSLDYIEGLTHKNISDLLEGVALKNYSFDKFKSKKSEKQTNTNLLIPKSKVTTKFSARNLQTITKATFFARDLVNTPANKCGPADVVRMARGRLKNTGVRVTAYNRTQLKKMSANLLLSVAEASSQAPYLLKIVYKPKGKSKQGPIALVGKGVTFDSGGLSIKSGGGMMSMKCDMAGAAAVIGAMEAIAALKPKQEVRAYVPLVENMIAGNATRPGDIIKGMNGKTVEILNTDAEGRLILSDALTLAEKDGAKKIISLATLTGACMVALGSLYAGLFSNNIDLCSEIKAAANNSGERLWELPLAEEYKEQLKSHPADIKNIGGSYGGAITAALFLQHSISKAHWAHIDLAGPAFLDSPHNFDPKGGTGFGVRTLVDLVMNV